MSGEARISDILLVGDEAGHAERLAGILARSEDEAYRLHGAATVAEAVVHLQAAGCDVVLLDAGLPGGPQANVRRLAMAARGAPVILLTDPAQPEAAAAARRAGAHDHLLKGFPDPEPLRRTLRSACELRRLRCRLDATREELDRLAVFDPVTEMLNRRGLERELLRELARLPAGRELILLVVDLDDFHRINERLGRGVGDAVLRQAGHRIREAIDGAGKVGRAGDDQFLVLLPRAQPAEGLVAAERVRLAVGRDAIATVGVTVRISATVGMAGVAPGTLSLSEALARAHVALQRGKAEGKNRVACIGGGPDALPRPVVLGPEMVRRLLCEDVLRVASQPIVRLADGRPISSEMLIRGPEGPLHCPDDLFRFSVEQDILTPLDLRCLQACVAAAEREREVASHHVNIMPSTLLETPTEELVRLLTRRAPRKRFCLELSEQQLLGDPAPLMPVVRALQAAGVRVAVDDVGFGNSCLEGLILLRPDVMKIDKRVVIGVGGDAASRRILERLLEIAAVLGTEVIAEGIENPEDLAVLRGLGVALGQGYYFGRPVLCGSQAGARAPASAGRETRAARPLPTGAPGLGPAGASHLVTAALALEPEPVGRS